MFRPNQAYRLEVQRTSLTSQNCEIAILQVIPVRRKGYVELETRRVCFRQRAGRTMPYSHVGDLPNDLYAKCRMLAAWAMRDDGPLLDELARRKSGEITSEIVSDISLAMLHRYNAIETALGEDEKLRAQVTTYLRARELPGGIQVSPGLINAVYDYISKTLDAEALREQMRKEEGDTPFRGQGNPVHAE